MEMGGSDEPETSDPILQDLLGNKKADTRDSVMCFYLEDVVNWSGAWIETKDGEKECTMVDLLGDKMFIDMTIDKFDEVMTDYHKTIRDKFWNT